MFKLAQKDLKLIFKHRRVLMLTFALPIALITLFALAFGGIGSGTSDTQLSLLVSDLDNTEESNNALKILDTLKSVDIKPADLAQAQKDIKKGREAYVLIIHKGFSDSLKSGAELPLELQYDAAKEIEVGLLQQSLIPTIAMMPFSIGNPKVGMAQRFRKMTKDADTETQERIQKGSDDLFDDLSKGISASEQNEPFSTVFLGGDIKMTSLVSTQNDNRLGLIQAVAGTAVMMLLFSVMGIGASLLDEKQEGTLKRLLYTPMNPINILFGKMLSANVISILQLVVMFVFAGLAFGLPIIPHIPGLMITIIATAFACSAFGVFLASFSKTRQQVQRLSMLIILVMSAIGGSMIPVFIMPPFMQKAAVASVNYWSIQGFYDVFWRNLSVTDTTFLSRIVILLSIGIILNLLAVLMFRRNILKMS